MNKQPLNIRIRKNVRKYWNRLADPILFNLSKLEPDELYLRRRYKRLMGKDLNIYPPVTYNEKLNWIKLYDRNPIYTKLADKVAVRGYVKERIGEEYLVPLLGIWDKAEDIDFSKLPNRFVLKCTHDSESAVICRDKSALDFDSIRNHLNKALKVNFYYYNREWVYKDIPHHIIAEEYLEDDRDGELRDYKIFCFDGVPRAMFIATDRGRHKTKFDFYDMDFNHLDFTQHYPNSDKPVHPPEHFGEMKKLAAKLSYGLYQVRVDFYEANGKVYFGEMTFFHHGGTTPFVPEKWDYIFGDWLKIPDEVYGKCKKKRHISDYI